MPAIASVQAPMSESTVTTRRSSMSASRKLNQTISTQYPRKQRSKSVTFSPLDVVFELPSSTSPVTCRSKASTISRDASPGRSRRYTIGTRRLIDENNPHKLSQRSFSTTSWNDLASSARLLDKRPLKRHHSVSCSESRGRRGRTALLSVANQKSGFPAGPSSYPPRNYSISSPPDETKRVCATDANAWLAQYPGMRGLENGRPAKCFKPLISTSDQQRSKPSSQNYPLRISNPSIRIHADEQLHSPSNAPSFHVPKQARERTYILRSLTMNDPHAECVVMLDAGVDQLLPPTFRALPTFKPSNIAVQASSGKGLGLIARDMMYPGEVIFAEHPILVLPDTVGTGVPLWKMYDDMFSRLSEHTRQELVCIASPRGSGTAPTSAHEVISRINPFAIPLSVPNEDGAELKAHRGVFLKMSRCKHSCGPNAEWRWDSASFSLVLIAIRSISPGEEITISYTDITLPHRKRRLEIQQTFGFTCLCQWCTLDDQSITESDAARRFLTTFWNSPTRPSFDEWCQDFLLPHNTLISEHQRALRLIEREGLQILSSAPRRTGVPTKDTIRHIDAIAKCYAALQDANKFVIWVKKGAEAREASNSLPLDYQRAFNKWVSNPRSYPLWGMRKPFYTREQPLIALTDA